MEESFCSLVDYSDLGFNQIWRDYIQGKEKLNTFFAHHYQKESDWFSQCLRLQNTYDKRNLKVEALRSFANDLGLSNQAKENIKAFQHPKSICIVTGQQLGFLGGPAFTIYKALSAIKLAQEWSHKLDVPVIPVFWLADEDHDYQEIRTAHILDINGNACDYSLKASKLAKEPAVSERLIEPKLETVIDDIFAHFSLSKDSKDYAQLLKRCYSESDTYGQAFARWVDHLLSPYGMVIAGSHHPEVKALMKADLAKAIKESGSILGDLQKNSNKLEKIGYKPQLSFSDTLLFLHTLNGRSRINFSDSCYAVDEAGNYTEGELLSLVENQPELFSPNAAFRPLLQDRLLPTLAYIAGPGELAYYAQLKPLYEHFGMYMPIIHPRLSLSILPTHLDRKLKQLGYKYVDFKTREENLQQRILNDFYSDLSPDFFEKMHNELTDFITPYLDRLDSDGINTHHLEHTKSFLAKEIDRLERKHKQGWKKREQQELKRAVAISRYCFPKQQLQERYLSASSLILSYGKSIINQLLDVMEDDQWKRNHLLLRLPQPTNRG